MFHYRDRLSLELSSGDGGDGLLSFFRSTKSPRGGPDGGDGGNGGALIFAVSSKVSSLDHLRKKTKYSAETGNPGGKQLKKGRKGKDLVLNLPIGTLIRNDKGQILKDFIKAQKEIFLKGGSGGHGNAFFKTSSCQAPGITQKGQKGQSQKVILEYKPLIYIAIVGKTNAGKSSFFNLATSSQSKEAPYPYTTLVPHIGQIKNAREKPLIIMDIPGIEKGASQSEIKGLSFLRTVQRAEILLQFIDGSFQPLKDKEEMEMEFKAFDKSQTDNYFKPLSRKKIFFILSKTDQLKSSKLKKLMRLISLEKDQKIFPLSNKSKLGLKAILQAIRKEVKP